MNFELQTKDNILAVLARKKLDFFYYIITSLVTSWCRKYYLFFIINLVFTFYILGRGIVVDNESTPLPKTGYFDFVLGVEWSD